MKELEEIRELLERYLAPILARSMLQRALRERGLSPERFRLKDAAKICPLLQRGITLFVSEHDRESALRELALLCEQMAPQAGPCEVQINSENDISIVRNEARRICEEIGAGSYTIQKITTIVSELARNIVSYATQGKLEIVPVDGDTRRVIVRAIDDGPGIPNISLVLSGRYRSRTGLGRGLLGTKRLSDHFDIKTSAAGTTVVAEVLV